MKYHGIFFGCIINAFLMSQNLISNSGFEDCDEKGNLSSWEMIAWTPDYYNLAFPKTYISDPYIKPIDKAFIRMLDGEAITIKLKDSLEIGKEYIIKIMVSRPNTFCPSGVTKITVAFTKGKLQKKEGKESSYYEIKYVNLFSSNLETLKKRGEWVCFSAFYKAIGGEKYFTLGTFGKGVKQFKKGENSEEDFIEIDSLNKSKCTNIYYDNISVEKSPILKNKPMVIDSIFFDEGKSVLLNESLNSLNKWSTILLKLTFKKIKISGYTDNFGTKKNNIELSFQRANCILNYFVKKGIPKNKIYAVGLADSKPIAPNSTEEGRSKNRRVEIEIIE